jgi:formate hydrogenlyase transcriptional activator
MIWNSDLATTVIDLIVIAAVLAVAIACRRQWGLPSARAIRFAPRLILTSLALIALFYLADLLSMHGLPAIIGEASARDFTTRLHLGAGRVVLLLALGLIAAGFLSLGASFRKSAKALETGEARYRSIVHDLNDLIVRWQPNGIVTWVNDPYCEAFDTTPAALIGSSFFPFMAEPDRARLLRGIDVLTPDAPTRCDVHEVRLPGGHAVWHEWTDHALFDEAGRLVEIQSVGRDVTERILTAKALEESEMRFRGFVESTSDWVWEMSRDGRHTYSNHQVKRMLGYTPEELRGMHWHELMHPADLDEIEARYESLVHEKRGWQQWIVRSRHRDGSYRYFESSAAPMLDKRGDVIGFRGIDRDATLVTLMSRLSASLIGCPTAELDERVETALEEIGSAYAIERISLWWVEGPNARRSHEWAREGKAGPIARMASDESIPWMSARLRRGEAIKVEALSDLPEASVDRGFLAAQRVRSTLALPVVQESELAGVAVFSTVSRERRWTGEVESDLRQLAEKIVGAYVQSEATRKVLRRERDLAQSEALAHVGSFAYYPLTQNASFPDEWRGEFSLEQCALFEMEPEEASFDLIMTRVHEDDRQLIMDAARDLLEGVPEIQLTFRLINPSGKKIYLSNRTQIDRDESGRNLRILGANRDITEQVLREESLQRALAEIEELRDRLELENVQLRQEVRTVKGFEQIVGDSDSLRQCLNLVAQAAPTDASILLLGETGTGKELVAKAVHDLSARRDRRMVSLNCTALPAELVESELFGHEKGAFTGAHQKREGRFEAADGGTLFLDEIADLPMSLQAKLLRVLQDGAFERVGGSETIRTDVRLIAATNRDLQEAVNNGAFRSDLYYRINTVPIQIPPLRERREDIPLLAQHFVMKHGPRLNKSIESISAAMLRYLQDQDWPGNVRELEHCIERSLIASRGPVLTLDERDRPRPGDGIGAGGNQVGNGGLADLRSIERDHILQVLAATRWVIGGTDGAAAGLDLPPSTLRSKMKKLGIERNAKQPARGIEKAEEGGNGKRHAKGVNLKGV